MKREDRKSRSEIKSTKREEPDVIIGSIGYGAKTAWNVFNLQARDMKQGYKEGIIETGLKRAGLSNGEYGDYKAEDFYRTENYQKTEEVMQKYIEAELENRKNYEDFYESLGDNQFAKLTSTFVYGATSNILNPIELSKNIAINAGVNAILPGANMGLLFTGNMLADSIDNYYSNSWEDELLGIEREPKEKIIASVSGALLSNAVFPAIKFGANKAFGAIKDIDVGSKYKFKNKEVDLKYNTSISENGGTLKGVTLRDDILDPAVAKAYKEELGKVSAIDLRYEDKDIHNSIIREIVENASTEDGTVRVHTKQVIKEGFTEETTGIKPTVLDYKAFMQDYIKQAKKIGDEATNLYNKNKGKGFFKSDFDSIETAGMSKKMKFSIEAKAREYIQNYLVNPIVITEEGYKHNMTKIIQTMNPKFINTLEMGLKNQGYYDVLGEDLEEKIVAKSVSDLIKDDIGGVWSLKNTDGYDMQTLRGYGYKLENQFKNSVANAVSFETVDADLHRTNPKFAKYFINSDNIDVFSQTMKDLADDFKAGKINKTELAIVLLDKETRYNIKPFTSSQGAQQNFSDYMKAFFDMETTKDLKVMLDSLRTERSNVAMTKLILDKPKLLSDLRTMDNKKLLEKLGDRIYNFNGITSPEDFTPEFQRNLWNTLSNTTKDVNEIKKDLTEIITGSVADYRKYDLMNFIDNTFNGINRKERLGMFLDFAGPYFRDNANMLNLMTNIIIQDKASMSALGLPFYEIQNIIKEKGSFLSFLNKVPAFRKVLMDNDINVEDFTGSQGHKIMDDIMMKYFSEYVESKSIFKKQQEELVEGAINGVLRITRDTLLIGTGIKEVFLHPISSAINSVKYGGIGFVEAGKGILLTPLTVTKAMFNALEPLANLTNITHKIYNGIDKMIGGEYSKEISLMEMMSNSDMLLSKGNSGALKKAYNTYSKVAMGIQEFQQYNRGVASRIFAINKIKKTLKMENFNKLTADMKPFFISVGIDNDIKFNEWKTKLNNKENVLKALYKKGYADETKYILQGIFKNLYEEDPMKHVRNKTRYNDIVSKVSMMFTNFQRAQLNRIGDAFKYAHLSDGSYIHRWHKDAMGKNFIDGLNIGIPAFIAYSTFGIFGTYIQSKVTGDSQDERITALVEGSKMGNKNAMKELFYMGSEFAIPYNGIFNRYSDTAIASLGKRLWEGVTEDSKKLLPNNAELLYNKYFGERQYKKYAGMDKQTRVIYDRLVLADKFNQANSSGIFDFIMAKLIADELVEDGEISKKEALEIKRKNGYNDEKIISNLNKRGLDTVINYSVLNSVDEIQVMENLSNGIEIIAENNFNKNEIVEALNEKNYTYHDMKEYEKKEEELKFTDDEMNYLINYENGLKNKGYDSFEISELKILEMKKILENRQNNIENKKERSYN